MKQKEIRRISFIGFFIMSVVLSGCLTSEKKKAPKIPEQDITVDFVRFDHKLMETPNALILDSLQSWNRQYPSFSQIYFQQILKFRSPSLERKEMVEQIEQFKVFPTTSLIQSRIDSIFPDMEPYNRAIRRAFQYAKYYLKEVPNMRVYYCNSEFSVQRFLFNDSERVDGIGVSLDLFLGEDFPYQRFMPDIPSFSAYMRRTYTREHLVKKVMEAWVEDVLGENKSSTLLEHMVYNGKKLYVLNKVLPTTPDTILLEYTERQLNWVEHNEQEMWAYLLKNKLFYSHDINKISTLVNPSPTSSGMPPASPGRTGNYLGWKIIEAYMARNPQIDLTGLIKENNAKKILLSSKFKPKRK